MRTTTPQALYIIFRMFKVQLYHQTQCCISSHLLSSKEGSSTNTCVATVRGSHHDTTIKPPTHCMPGQLILYHIAGNFRMVQTFAVFADGPLLRK